MTDVPNRCPICDEIGRVFVRRDGVPVHQNQLCVSVDQARAVVVGDLRISHCRNCDFIWNAAFDPDRLSYHHDYDNTQTCSPRFSDYLSSLVSLLVEERDVRGSRIVEVGCGNGEFLRRLVRADPGNTGTGFDPSYRGPPQDLDRRVLFERCFFGPDEAAEAADVVISRHVIEHLDEPVSMLELMRRAIESAPDPRMFLETPDVAWILERRVVWDFFYEHCSYFTPRSLEFAARLAGLELVGVDLVFGSQYQWAQVRPAQAARDPVGQTGAGLAAATEEFEHAERRLWAQLADQLAQLATEGPVAVWGAGAKGVTFANQLDPEAEIIAGVVDLNPAKQGGFLPGTGHPIVSPQAAEDGGIANAILLNPNYEQEIADMLASTHSRVNLVRADEASVIGPAAGSQQP